MVSVLVIFLLWKNPQKNDNCLKIVSSSSNSLRFLPWLTSWILFIALLNYSFSKISKCKKTFLLEHCFLSIFKLFASIHTNLSIDYLFLTNCPIQKLSTFLNLKFLMVLPVFLLLQQIQFLTFRWYFQVQITFYLWINEWFSL